MNAEPHVDGCKGCAISRQDPGEDLVRRIRENGDIFELTSRWVLHHYTPRDKSDGFLGWLVLQPYKHRRNLGELDDDEAGEFGKILRAIEKRLRAYWEKEFSEDPLEHVYVAYFQESSEHLHLHIVPRPKSFRDLPIGVTATSASGTIYKMGDDPDDYPKGWHVYLASKCPRFPDKYRMDEQTTKRLMEFLRANLPSAKSRRGR